jgi:hypothetical protein
MLRFLFILLIWPLAAHADGLSVDMRAQISAGPQRFEADVAGLILGYGAAQGINAQGIEQSLAVARAKLRVREMRRLMLVDLDDDGSVTQAELFVVLSAQGANARGSLWQAHNAADHDSDGVVTTKEMQTQARLVADQAMTRAVQARDVMQLDFDKNGYVTMPELQQALAMVVPDS